MVDPALLRCGCTWEPSDPEGSGCSQMATCRARPSNWRIIRRLGIDGIKPYKTPIARENIQHGNYRMAASKKIHAAAGLNGARKNLGGLFNPFFLGFLDD